MKKLLQQALDALENSYPTPTYQESTSSMFEMRRKAIAALKAELAKPEPKVVAWQERQEGKHKFGAWYHCSPRSFSAPREKDCAGIKYQWRPLYAAPTEPNCKFPTCHSQEYQDKLVQEILGQEPIAWLSTDCIGERYLCFTKPTDHDPVVPLYTKGTTNAENR